MDTCILQPNFMVFVSHDCWLSTEMQNPGVVIIHERFTRKTSERNLPDVFCVLDRED